MLLSLAHNRFIAVFLNTGEEPPRRITMGAEFNLQESQALPGRAGSGSLAPSFRLHYSVEKYKVA